MAAKEKATWGGKREGAGRKKTGMCRDVPHRARPELDARNPVHVVVRMKKERRIGLRRGRLYTRMRKVVVRYLGRDDFRIVHISIQQNHVHLIVEAASTRALTRGMQSFTINAARAINADHSSIGKVWEFRYHATQIRTARQARNTLAYVLNNWRRHREDFANGRLRTAKLDPYASGLSLGGWTERFALPADYTPLPVSPPRTRLLRHDWKRFGLLDPHEAPGPLALGGYQRLF
ncbi:MAG: transposase [Acidobacteriota bacterium]